MRKYEIRVIPKKDIEGNVYWSAFFPTIDECVGGGDTAEDAIREAEENLEFYLSYLESEKLPLPDEYQENNYNGRILLRTSKSSHKKLSRLAEDEGVSLNTIVNNAIEHYLGKKSYDIELSNKIEQLTELSQSSNILQQMNYAGNQQIVSELWKRSFKVPYMGGENE